MAKSPPRSHRNVSITKVVLPPMARTKELSNHQYVLRQFSLIATSAGRIDAKPPPHWGTLAATRPAGSLTLSRPWPRMAS